MDRVEREKRIKQIEEENDCKVKELFELDTADGLARAFESLTLVEMNNGYILCRDGLEVWDPKKNRSKNLPSIEAVIEEYGDQLKDMVAFTYE